MLGIQLARGPDYALLLILCASFWAELPVGLFKRRVYQSGRTCSSLRRGLGRSGKVHRKRTPSLCDVSAASLVSYAAKLTMSQSVPQRVNNTTEHDGTQTVVYTHKDLLHCVCSLLVVTPACSSFCWGLADGGRDAEREPVRFAMSVLPYWCPVSALLSTPYVSGFPRGSTTLLNREPRRARW